MHVNAIGKTGKVYNLEILIQDMSWAKTSQLTNGKQFGSSFLQTLFLS